jgi:hypothetical protein
MSIRSFHNADLPTLVEIWNEHWSAIGMQANVTAAMFEQAVLSRRFFRADQLLVAQESEDPASRVQGWCHFVLPMEAENGKVEQGEAEGRGDAAIVCGLCARPSQRAALDELLEAAEQRIATETIRQIRVGLVRDSKLGYAGLNPMGHGVGVSNFDGPTVEALTQRGYQSYSTTLRMQVSVTGFRPPVSREAMQLRRSARVRVEPFSHNSARRAASMSHLDVETHRLEDPAGNDLAKVNLWFSDAEAEVMDPTMVILDLHQPHESGELSGAESYLIGAVIQSLSQRRISRVETAIDQKKSGLLEELGKLSFKPSDEGMAWDKTL